MNLNSNLRFNLKNKVILITGSAGLLGYEHAFAVLAAGAEVVLTDIDLKKLILIKDKLIEGNSDFASRIFILNMDVTDLESIHFVSDKVLKKYGRIDVLINNAAINPKVEQSNVNLTRLENFTIDQWNLELSVGLTGAFLCIKEFGSIMARGGLGGNIINICSDLSVIAPDQRLYEIEGVSDDLQSVKPVSYSVIKHGLVGLTKYVATYWIKEGVRCNCISPGGVFVNQPIQFLTEISKRIPVGRMAYSHEYREAIIFLASEASSYMNGHNLVIDGGRSIW